MGETVILALWGAAATAALAYWVGFAARESPGLSGAAVKTASTGFLALALWLLVPQAPPLWPLALGLTLGALGDLCLAQRGEAAFLAGMAAFGAGHLAYAGHFLAVPMALGFPDLTLPRLVLALALIALMASTEHWLAPRTGKLRGPVRAYVILIGLMGISLLVLPAGAVTGWLWLGGSLFILSDLLLALRLFVAVDPQRQRLLSLTLWPAYWGGQALIAGFGPALAATGQG